MLTPMTKPNGNLELRWDEDCARTNIHERTPRRGKARAPIHAKVSAAMNCSQLIGGLAGAAISRSVRLTNFSGIGGGRKILLWHVGAAVVIGNRGGTSKAFGAADGSISVRGRRAAANCALRFKR